LRKEHQVLLVHSPADPTSRFSHYLRELLCVEGFAAIDEITFDHLGAALAARPDGVILPRMQLPLAIADELVQYVVSGGRLVALQPDSNLVKRLGLVPGYINVTDGILACVDSGLLEGLPLDPVQIIIPAARWSTGGSAAVPLGWVSGPDDPFARHPAIWHVEVGAGEAVLFAFDLAKSVSRLRHGDPDLADMPNEIFDRNTRPSDLFRGQLDPRQATVPQADILTAVLGRVVETLMPQPRLWYYPDSDQRSVFIQTSDDDWSTIEQFETMLAVLRQYDATCTFYVVDRSQLTTDHMDRWEQEGHVFSVHPATRIDVEGLPPTDESQRLWVPAMVRENVERHRAQYGRPVNTIRNHAIRWVGYMDLARLHVELGIRAEANYFAMGVILSGYLTGSGRVAPFVDQTGEVIDHLQIPSHWTEEILVSDAHGFSERWLPSRARDFTNGIINRAITRYHTPTVINSHPVSFATYSRPLIESNWQTAHEGGVPIISADAWVQFTDARRDVSISLTPDGFTVTAGRAVDRVVVLCDEGTDVSANGSSTSSQTIWGRRYTAVTLHDLIAGEARAVGARSHGRVPA
jgi:hypothetical protein